MSFAIKSFYPNINLNQIRNFEKLLATTFLYFNLKNIDELIRVLNQMLLFLYLKNVIFGNLIVFNIVFFVKILSKLLFGYHFVLNHKMSFLLNMRSIDLIYDVNKIKL